jgi:hypothetical protein
MPMRPSSSVGASQAEGQEGLCPQAARHQDEKAQVHEEKAQQHHAEQDAQSYFFIVVSILILVYKILTLDGVKWKLYKGNKLIVITEKYSLGDYGYQFLVSVTVCIICNFKKIILTFKLYFYK